MPQTWPAKDPQAVADYRYNVALDQGDTLSSIVINKLSGDVVLGDTTNDASGITAWLSGGTDGETAVFRVSWVTAGGREADDIITLAVAANEPSQLSGYDKPTPAHLVQRYPAFRSVDAGTIRMWLTDAERFVDTSWIEGDYAPALMAVAAHNMARGGLGASSSASIPAGVTRFKSGAVDVTISESAAAAQSRGGYASTSYGLEFLALQRRSFGGPRVIAAGTLPACGYP